ncbi:MAG: protein kinase [bacterium]
MVGKKLAHYEILEKIGAGGMGEVYKATDTRLGRTVAIKVLPGHLSEKPELRARFEREARAISSLSHPHICTLHDVGTADGVDFLVMELLEGETLAQRLVRDKLTVAQVLSFGTEIASALDAAHRRGIVHRDLKPGNVMLTRNGVKLLDFGLAKLVETSAVPGVTAVVTEARTSEPLTERGTVLGTFRYMSPEQLEGKEADPRTDIFALGAVLYEMSTGRPAFEGKSQASLIAAILEREPPPVSSIEPLTPPAFERTVRRCLAKDPEARWQSAADVAAELHWISEESSRAGVPLVVAARRRSRERLLWLLAWPLAAVAIALGVVVQRLASREAPVIRASILPPEGRFFDLNSFEPGPATISPDGTKIVFATSGGPKDSLWVRSLDSEEPRLLLAASSIAYPFWSWDGRSLGFFAARKLQRIEVAGGPPLALCDAPNGKGGSWSRNGVILFAPDAGTALYRVAAAGGDTVRVTRLDSTRAENSHRLPCFLPDGRHFLFFARGAGSTREAGTVMVGSLDGEKPRSILRSPSQALFASGRLLFLREKTLMAQPFDLGRLALRGEATPVANAVGLLTGAGCAGFSVSRTGVLAYHPDQPAEVTELVWHDRTGARIGTLGEPAAYAGEVRFSPDGRRLAAEILDPDTGRSNLWIYDLGRDLLTRFTFDPRGDSSPTWSADGAYVYFASTRKGHSDLYRKAVAGPDNDEAVLESAVDKFPQFCSPDGRFLVFVQGDDLWALPLAAGGAPAAAGGAPTLLLKSANSAACSPDGRWMTYVSAESGRPESFLTAFPQPGRKWQVSPKGSVGAVWWTPRQVMYLDLGNVLWWADITPQGAFDVEVGKPQKYAEAPNVQGGDVHPDGKRSLFVTQPGERKSLPVTLVVNWTKGLRH